MSVDVQLDVRPVEGAVPGFHVAVVVVDPDRQEGLVLRNCVRTEVPRGRDSDMSRGLVQRPARAIKPLQLLYSVAFLT